MLDARSARQIIDEQVATIRRDWTETCDEAGLAQTDRDYFWGRQFMNEYAFHDYALKRPA